VPDLQRLEGLSD
jgi:hypothetical protein